MIFFNVSTDEYVCSFKLRPELIMPVCCNWNLLILSILEWVYFNYTDGMFSFIILLFLEMLLMFLLFCLLFYTAKLAYDLFFLNNTFSFSIYSKYIWNINTTYILNFFMFILIFWFYLARSLLCSIFISLILSDILIELLVWLIIWVHGDWLQ